MIDKGRYLQLEIKQDDTNRNTENMPCHICVMVDRRAEAIIDLTNEDVKYLLQSLIKYTAENFKNVYRSE